MKYNIKKISALFFFYGLISGWSYAGDYEMDHSCIKDLTKSIEDNSNESLYLYFDKLDKDDQPDKEALLLTDVLEKNTTIKSLKLYGDEISAIAMVALANALTLNKTLESLILSRCIITAEVGKAFEHSLALNKKLKELRLDIKPISYEAMLSLTNALKENTSLKEVSFDFEKLPYEGLPLLADVVVQNKTINNFSLNDDDISDEGKMLFLNALKFNNTLFELRFRNEYEYYLEETKVKIDIGLELAKNIQMPEALKIALEHHAVVMLSKDLYILMPKEIVMEILSWMLRLKIKEIKAS